VADENFSEIPIMDWSRWHGSATERDAFVAELIDICHNVGFFMVVNHGIESSFTTSVFDMMQDLFALPTDQKLLIDKNNSRHFRGWEKVGSEYTNNRPDMREQVDTWSEHPARDGDVDPNYLRLLGPNQWLPDEVLPGFKDLTLEWFAKLGSLADEILGALSLGLGLTEDHLRNLFGEECMSLTKFIHYPPTPAGAAGVNAHHDAGFLTVLAAGQTPGLEVQSPSGDWIPVPIVPDAFVINLGEMLQGISQNYLIATPHRVITEETRFSAGYFHGPSLHTSLAPLPLAPTFADAVASSPHHATAGFMAQAAETEAGVADMSSEYMPDTYGSQLWNYFSRSYPDVVAQHYSS
jgi:isopenicillin N synthase-like dioxygenase